MTKKSKTVELDPVLLLGFGALLVVAGAVVYGIFNSEDFTASATVDTIPIHASNELPESESNQEAEQPDSKQVPAIDTRSEVNRVLAAAGIATISQWSGFPDCGPTDAFLGTYSLRNSTTFITQSEADQLRQYGLTNNLTVEDYGLDILPDLDNFSVSQDNWQISVLYDDEGVVTLRAFINSLQELPQDITASSSFCG